MIESYNFHAEKPDESIILTFIITSSFESYLDFRLITIIENMAQPHRKAVLNLYKTLLYMGRDWPQGYDLFRKRLHKVFSKNSEESDPNKVATMIKHGDFVVKEIEALYKLKKYRTLKRRYYDDN